MTIPMPPIFNISQILDLVDIIAMINTIRVTIFTITIISVRVTINHEKESTIFVAKKIVTLISI